MPPLFLRIHVLNTYGREIRLWIPLFLLWLLVLPFAIVVLPVLLIVAVVLDVDPFSAIAGVMRVLSSLRGSHVEVDSAQASVFVHVY
jgi:hypothetical protein